MLLFSDLHLKEESADTVFGQVLPGIQEAARESGETVIACLGDLFTIRYRVEVRLLNQLRDHLLSWVERGHVVLLLPGNHDQVDVAGRNVLEVLGDIPGVTVYTHPTLDQYGMWLPYRKRPEALAEALSLYPGARGTCYTHHGIQGAWRNDSVLDSDGLPIQMFAQFTRVFTGHYHKHHTVADTITYVGSPYQTKADESGQEKGFIVSAGDAFIFHARKWGPRYHRINLESVKDLAKALEGVDPGDDVRVTTGSTIDPAYVGKFLEKAGVRHTVTPQVEVAKSRLQVPPGAGIHAYAGPYVAGNETHLDKDRLMAIYEELTV